MKWTDLDLPEGQWTLQATVTKSKRLAIVPLSKLAIGILADLPRFGPYVFAGASGNKPISGYATAMTKLGSLPGGEAIKHWTFHDLRRTAATEMGRLDTREDIIGKVFNHSAKGITGRIYNRYGYLFEKSEALEKWAAYLANPSSPPTPANVADLSAARERRHAAVS